MELIIQIILGMVVGGLVGLVDGTMICFIYMKAKKQGDRKPEYSLKIFKPLIYFVVLILVLGAISQIWYYFI